MSIFWKLSYFVQVHNVEESLAEKEMQEAKKIKKEKEVKNLVSIIFTPC